MIFANKLKDIRYHFMYVSMIIIKINMDLNRLLKKRFVKFINLFIMKKEIISRLNYLHNFVIWLEKWMKLDKNY